MARVTQRYQQRQRRTWCWSRPARALAGLGRLLDGLITNGKFCCVRHVRMDLTWWHQPLRLRRSALQADAALPGASHDPDLDRLPPAQPASDRKSVVKG